MLKTFTNRVLPLVLALMMVITLVPSLGNVAYADDTWHSSEQEWGLVLSTDKATYAASEDVRYKIEGFASTGKGPDTIWMGLYYYGGDYATSLKWKYINEDVANASLGDDLGWNFGQNPGHYYLLLTTGGDGNDEDAKWAWLDFTVESQAPDNEVTVTPTEFIYDGEVHVPTVTIDGLTAGTDYDLVYENENSKDPGTYKITIQYKGEYSGSKVVTYKIKILSTLTTDKTEYYIGDPIMVSGTSDYSDAWVGLYEYDNSTPLDDTLICYYYLKDVSEPIDILRDYWVYDKPSDLSEIVGHYKVILFTSGYNIDDTTGQLIVRSFWIKDYDASLSKTEFDYNGEVQKPAVTVMRGNEELTLGTDYTLVFENENSKDAGTYKVTVNFTNEEIPSKELSYKISPKEMTEADVSLDKDSFDYVKGTAQKPVVTIEGLTENTDYTVTYSNENSEDIGEYTVTVVFKGNYTGKVEKTYSIACKHNYQDVPGTAKEATCGADGKKADQKCANCGDVIVGETIKATGNHTWDAGTVKTPATETAEGVKEFKCTVCGATKTEAIPKLEPTPTPVEPAAPAKVTLTVSLEGTLAKANDGSYMAAKEVTVEDLDKDGALTFDEALKAAHKAYNAEAGYAVGGPYDSVQKLWGVETSNTLFFINNAGIATGVTYDTVKEGDYLVASANKDNTYYADWYTYFENGTATAAVGDEVTLTLKGHLGMAYTEDEKKDVPIAGVTVKTADGKELGTTDKDGKVTFTMDQKGTYVVTAEGTTPGTVTDWATYEQKTADCPIIAPQATVTITVKKATPTVTLKKDAFVYSTKVKRPSVTVKVGDTKLTTADYTVKYATGRKNVGKYSVKVTLKNNYSGSKTVYFKINPKGTSIKSVVAGKKALTVKWNKQATKMAKKRITGYQIWVSTSSKFTKKTTKKVTVKEYKKVSKKITGLKANKKYYVKVRTYTTISGANYYSAWSKVKTKKTAK